MIHYLSTEEKQTPWANTKGGDLERVTEVPLETLQKSPVMEEESQRPSTSASLLHYGEIVFPVCSPFILILCASPVNDHYHRGKEMRYVVVFSPLFKSVGCPVMTAAPGGHPALLQWVKGCGKDPSAPMPASPSCSSQDQCSIQWVNDASSKCS